MGNSHSISDCMAGGGSIEDDLITIPAEVTSKPVFALSSPYCSLVVYTIQDLFHSLDNSKIKRIRDELKAVDFIFLFDNSERERERLVVRLVTSEFSALTQVYS